MLFASERRGLAPAWPDQGPARDILKRHLGSVVRALAAGGDASLEETAYRDRAAWVLDAEIRVNLVVRDDSPDHLSVTVDQETGLPVRPTGPHPPRCVDPLATGEGYVDEPETVTFSARALEGHSGALLIDPLAIPHVWTVTDDLVVTVSGDLTPAELVDVAESIQQSE